MKPFRCLICGETYMGEGPADRCPFCGVQGKYLVAAPEWINYGSIKMSDESYSDCEKALSLELNNQAFYKCAASSAETQISEAIFKRLSKQEGEHAELIAEMMGVEEPAMPQVECTKSDEENFMESHRRESGAIKFYLEIASRAPEERVKQVFRALAEVESEHLKVSNIFR